LRVTVSHNKPVEEVKRAVDRSFDDLFRGSANIPVQIISEHKQWQSGLLTFACTAKMGLLRSGIKGTVLVTEKDVTIDADLGFLERLLAAKGIRSTIEGKVKGLLT
jgi:hypothetical protein